MLAFLIVLIIIHGIKILSWFVSMFFFCHVDYFTFTFSFISKLSLGALQLAMCIARNASLEMAYVNV